MFEFRIGDKVIYDSAAAIDCPATVKNIDFALNAAGDVIPWVTLEIKNPKFGNPRYPYSPMITTARIAATKGNFAMMKVRKVEG